MTDNPPEGERVEAPTEGAGLLGLHQREDGTDCPYAALRGVVCTKCGWTAETLCDQSFGGIWPCILPFGHDGGHRGGITTPDFTRKEDDRG